MTSELFAPHRVFKLSINKNHSKHLECFLMKLREGIAPSFMLWFMLDLLFVFLKVDLAFECEKEKLVENLNLKLF